MDIHLSASSSSMSHSDGDVSDEAGPPVTNGKEQRSLWLHRWMWLVFDAAIWFAAIYGATWLRYDFVDPAVLGSATLTFAAAATVTYLVVGVVIGPYAVEHRRGSFEETANLSGTVLATASALLVWAFVANPLIVPRSVPVVAGALALVSMF